MAERTIVTKVSNAILYSDGSIRIDGGRCSYPHVGKAYESEGDDGNKKSQYSVTLMLPKDTHTAAKDLVKKVIQELLTKEDAKVGTGFWFLKDGDKEAEEDEKKEVYAGHWLIKLADSRRPSVRDRKGNVMTPEEAEDEFYGGMYANVLLRPWYFNGKAKNGKSYPKRVLANFLGIQKLRDSEPFGEGRISDDGVFEAVDGDGDNGFDDNNDL